MKKMYQTPEIEIKMFNLRSDILGDIAESEVSIMPPDDLDSNTRTYSVNDTIGFGW